jgi:hypothetical protein
MEPIQVFTFGNTTYYYDDIYFNVPNGDYKLTLENFVNKYPIGSEELGTNTDTNIWTKSKVATSSGDISDTNIRNSYEARLYATLNDNLDKKLKSSVLKMIPRYLRSAVSLDSHIYNNIRLLAYTKGDFFARHVDSKKNNVCTCLIFPPANKEPFIHTGGLLRIEKPDSTIFEFDSSTTTEWTVVMFEPTLPHECLPVESGNRYVIKLESPSFKYNKLAELISNEKTVYDFDSYEKLLSDIDIVQNQKNELENKVKTLKSNLIELIDSFDTENLIEEMNKIIALKNNDDDPYNNDYDETKSGSDSEIVQLIRSSYSAISDLNENIESSDETYNYNNQNIESLIAKIDRSTNQSFAIVILKIYYPIADIRNLYKYDFELMKALNDKYTNVKIKNFEIETMADYYKNQSIHQLFLGINDDSTNSADKVIFYQSGLKYSGSVINQRSEYNDQDYDTIYRKNISCFLITK